MAPDERCIEVGMTDGEYKEYLQTPICIELLSQEQMDIQCIGEARQEMVEPNCSRLDVKD